MKRTVAVCLGTVSVAVALAAPPASASNVGNGCVGSAVSAAAHTTQQEAGIGLGVYLHSVGLNPGKDIQAYSEGACSTG